MNTSIISTPFGNLKLIASMDALHSCVWTAQMDCVSDNTPVLKEANAQLQAYFRGELEEFDLPLKAEGTVFQKSVWTALLTIPYGKTCAYQDIANLIGNAKAVRAVGMANGKNPLCIFIPCHRVIYASKKIGGYSGGVEYKEQLLDLESRALA